MTGLEISLRNFLLLMRAAFFCYSTAEKALSDSFQRNQLSGNLSVCPATFRYVSLQHTFKRITGVKVRNALTVRKGYYGKSAHYTGVSNPI